MGGVRVPGDAGERRRVCSPPGPWARPSRTVLPDPCPPGSRLSSPGAGVASPLTQGLPPSGEPSGQGVPQWSPSVPLQGLHGASLGPGTLAFVGPSSVATC